MRTSRAVEEVLRQFHGQPISAQDLGGLCDPVLSVKQVSNAVGTLKQYYYIDIPKKGYYVFRGPLPASEIVSHRQGTPPTPTPTPRLTPPIVDTSGEIIEVMATLSNGYLLSINGTLYVAQPLDLNSLTPSTNQPHN